MTVTNVTPTEPTNEPQNTEQPIDNMGNPVNPDGTPAEPKPPENEGGETIESLQKALKDTKAELTRLQQAQPKEPEANPQESNDTPTDLEIRAKEAEEKGVDFSKYSEEYNTEGTLSDESYKELADQGYDRQLVDDYIAGQKARVSQQTTEISQVVGGEENLQPVLDWAAENLSEDEIAAYNVATQNGVASAKLALQGVYSRFVAANGDRPNLIQGQGTPIGKDVFKSSFEMTKAQQDPRYWSDPDYQAEVQAKIERSHRAGTI